MKVQKNLKIFIVAAFLACIGTVYAFQSGQFNTTLPSVGSGTYAPIQADASGRTLVSTDGAVADPCMAPGIAKSNFSVSVTADTELVALTSGQTIFLCGSSLTLGGTAPTVAFVYGTGTTCGTGQTSLTGAINPTAGLILNLGWGGTVFSTAVSNALCILITGTTPTIRGQITYVKR
jgi:hypothetical protein